ncbi:DUF4245 family protein [Aeromicrobium ginsengisoli]|uniref:DUF4245 domain-containing protein n=1 Tax=Aeromicrobium ginsengisoli TaxID=363867 RepID=A0A5M4FJN6_9ACTN|nr:DUF4245 family protein [Aeromicrobium ginsengisoli]KAA1400271.1 DUF4245 domain-containing protein [Aeromicrobium ginsengisoli]
MSTQRSSRGNPSMGDIVRSVVVIGVIIIGLYGIGKVFSDKPDSPTPAVDYAKLTDQARPVAGFELLAPSSLPRGWHANAATLNIDWWHLGIVRGDQDYIGLDQVKGTSVTRAIERFADGSRPDGKTDIGGETWSVRKGPGDRTTYVLTKGEVTTVIVGTPSRALIEDYIGSLATS